MILSNVITHKQFLSDAVAGAVFSNDRRYRYTLWRRWARKDLPIEQTRICAFVGLNPSTANECTEDPTVRRCINFSRDWGFDTFVMLNIFAWRDTDPAIMKRQKAPIGACNEEAIRTVQLLASRMVACWGIDGDYMGQGERILKLLDKTKTVHLGLTKEGHPKHPLYLARATMPTLFEQTRE
jgi:hypothetical protein